MPPPLPPQGFLIVDLNLPPRVIDAALEEGRALTSYQAILGEVGGHEDDQFRLQARIVPRSSALREFRKAIQEVCACLSPHWKPEAFAFLCSLPGGPPQGAHRDFTPEDMERARWIHEDCIPGSAIVALEQGTSLRVYEGCFDDAIAKKEKMVQISPGSCIFFRGDLFHSGAGYMSENHRLHCYLTVGDKQWKPDFVHGSRGSGFLCQHCEDFEDDNSAKVRQHRYVCKRTPRVWRTRRSASNERRTAPFAAQHAALHTPTPARFASTRSPTTRRQRPSFKSRTAADSIFDFRDFVFQS
jgi:hypothetical protein